MSLEGEHRETESDDLGAPLPPPQTAVDGGQGSSNSCDTLLTIGCFSGQCLS